MKKIRSKKIYFSFEKYQTNYHNEIVAGITTFVTMAYRMIQNPAILSETGIIGNKREELNFGLWVLFALSLLFYIFYPYE